MSAMTNDERWLEGYERRRPKRAFSYVIVDNGPHGADLFKTFVNGGSVHLAPFPNRSEAMQFVRSLPPARLVIL
jgi:hypothetical protein